MCRIIYWSIKWIEIYLLKRLKSLEIYREYIWMLCKNKQPLTAFNFTLWSCIIWIYTSWNAHYVHIVDQTESKERSKKLHKRQTIKNIVYIKKQFVLQILNTFYILKIVDNFTTLVYYITRVGVIHLCVHVIM